MARKGTAYTGTPQPSTPTRMFSAGMSVIREMQWRISRWVRLSRTQ